MRYLIESFGVSDLGLGRESNEDVFHLIPLHGFFVVADGMGGHRAGEVAAKEAVHHLSASICRMFADNKENESLQELLHKALGEANRWVHRLSEQKEEFRGMGTTLCCLLLREDTVLCAHVGDSRIYRFRNRLESMTTDHRIESPGKGKKNLLTRAVGTSAVVEPEIGEFSVRCDDLYFLCSDGLTDYVSEEEISDILTRFPCIKTASSKLVEKAKENGGADNITVLMLKVMDENRDLFR